MHIEDTTIHNLKEEASNAAKATIVMKSTYTFQRKNMIRNKYIPIHPSQIRKLQAWMEIRDAVIICGIGLDWLQQLAVKS